MSKLTAQDYARGCLLRIVAQPGRYDQMTWQTIAVDDVDFGGGTKTEISCPTTGCVAGTAAMLAGDRAIVNEYDLTSRNGKKVYSIGTVITDAGRTIGIRQRGQQLLELSDDQAAWLFSGDRKLPEVVNALIELSEGKELSYTMQYDMSKDEIEKLKNYRVPPVVKRQHMPAAPATPAPVNALQHRG